MTRTLSGFLLWMLFVAALALFIREAFVPETPLYAVLVLYVFGGVLTYLRNYQLDHRPRLSEPSGDQRPPVSDSPHG